jgi:hypothetical protein
MKIYLGLFVFIVALSGCGGAANVASNATNGITGGNSNSGTDPLATKTVAPEQASNNAPTLTPVVKAFCSAWVKNDEAALRKVYSAATLKQFESEMKEEKAPTLIKLLESTDSVKAEPCEASNEKIEGDRATARIKTTRYPNSVEVVFVKEGGEWKMTNEVPSFKGSQPKPAQ